MVVVRVERLGGFAGFGDGPLRSLGEVDLDDLPEAERRSVAALFDAPGAEDAAPGGDRFRYRLTLENGESVELDEDSVPERIRNSVTDQLL